MRQLARTLTTLGVLAVLVSAAGPVLAADAGKEVVPCSDCHDVVVAAFAANPHAQAQGRGADANAICAACHSGGAAHAASGDPGDIGIPRGDAGAWLCLNCHATAGPNPIEPRSVHARSGLGCEGCHTMHPAGRIPEALLTREGSSACVSCHTGVAGSFRKPYTHRMHTTVGGSSRAGMQCAACHNPHGRSGEANLVRTRAGEVACLGCHTDKRGPFVFTHISTEVAGCLGCHEPHGSTNPKMLKRSRVAQLCLECHSVTSPATVGSQPPSFHDLRSPRYQNCTTCHVAVHGSNSSPLLLR